jgi:hypothetical protein
MKSLAVFRIRVDFGWLDPDPDPGGQKTHKKRVKVKKFLVF